MKRDAERYHMLPQKPHDDVHKTPCIYSQVRNIRGEGGRHFHFFEILGGGEPLIRTPPYSVFENFGGGGYLLLGPPLIAFSKKKFILSIFNMHFLLKYLTYSHHLATKIMPLLSST